MKGMRRVKRKKIRNRMRRRINEETNVCIKADAAVHAMFQLFCIAFSVAHGADQTHAVNDDEEKRI